jgi:hypothetical protein
VRCKCPPMTQSGHVNEVRTTVTPCYVVVSPGRARREVRAQDEPAIQTACLETAVRVGDLIE